MEKETIVLLVIIILAIITTVLTLKVSYKKYQETTYVHIKTGNIYRIIQPCLMKYNGVWMDAVVYTNNNEIFVREKGDFNKSFKKLSGWKKEVQHK